MENVSMKTVKKYFTIIVVECIKNILLEILKIFSWL